jgi:predicted flap endonuclease-1-like 5' DNA nuclease
MSMSSAILFIVVLLAALLIIWFLRTRGNTAGRHVDTTMTAVGAATEAVEGMVDDVVHAFKGDEPVSKSKPAEVVTLKSAPTPRADPTPKADPVPKAATAPKAVAKVEVVKPAPAPKAAPAPKVAAKAKPAAKSVAAAPKAEPKPKTSAKPAAAMTALGVPAAVGAPDNLRQLKGVGPKLNTLLVSLGITRFDQVAAWGEAEIAKVDPELGTFKGRIVRDSWIEQAAFLAKGDVAGFEAKFGKLDSPTNT